MSRQLTNGKVLFQVFQHEKWVEASKTHQFVGTLPVAAVVVGESIAATLEVLGFPCTGGVTGSHAIPPDNEGVI